MHKYICPNLSQLNLKGLSLCLTNLSQFSVSVQILFYIPPPAVLFYIRKIILFLLLAKNLLHDLPT